MRAIDANVLIFAHIVSSRHHDRARRILREFAESPHPWAIPWPCVYEFLRVVTHPRVYHPPSPIEVALADLASIFGSPSLSLLSETPRHAAIMESLIRKQGLRAI